MLPRSISILTVLSLGLLGCATASSHAWRGPQGQKCWDPSADPEAIEAEALLRTSGDLPEVTFPPGVDSLLVVASYDSLGALSGVGLHAPMGVAMKGEGTDAPLRERFAASGPPKSRAYAMFVRRGEPVLHAHRVRVECEPALLNRPELARRLGPIADKLVGGEGEALIWMSLDETGEVKEVKVHRGSGRVRADLDMIQVARAARFTPALVDGFAVPAWVAVPFNFRPGGRAPEILRPVERSRREAPGAPSIW